MPDWINQDLLFLAAMGFLAQLLAAPLSGYVARMLPARVS
jgi:hypothetical protein